MYSNVRVIYTQERPRSILCRDAPLFGFTVFTISNSAGLFDFLSLSGLGVDCSKEESTAAFVNYLEWSHCDLLEKKHSVNVKQSLVFFKVTGVGRAGGSTAARNEGISPRGEEKYAFLVLTLTPPENSTGSKRKGGLLVF